MDRGEQIRVEVARHLLEDAGQALQPETCIDARERQGHATRGALVELHEDQVPELEPARAALGVVRDALRALGEVGAAIEVDLAARAARSGVGHPPEVAVVARVDVAPDRHSVRRQPDLVAPDLAGDLIILVGRRGQALRRDAEVPGQEVPRVVDRVTLEVVAEAPVAEHLEERVVARRPADLLEVVVLAGDAQDALVVDRPGVVALLDAGQDVLELDHPGVREEERRVAGRNEAGTRHGGVAAFREELDEASTDLGGRQRLDPRIALGDGGRHGRNGTERAARSNPAAGSAVHVRPSRPRPGRDGADRPHRRSRYASAAERGPAPNVSIPMIGRRTLRTAFVANASRSTSSARALPIDAITIPWSSER